MGRVILLYAHVAHVLRRCTGFYVYILYIICYCRFTMLSRLSVCLIAVISARWLAFAGSEVWLFGEWQRIICHQANAREDEKRSYLFCRTENKRFFVGSGVSKRGNLQSGPSRPPESGSKSVVQNSLEFLKGGMH